MLQAAPMLVTSQVLTPTFFIRPLTLTSHVRIHLLLLWTKPTVCTPTDAYQDKDKRLSHQFI